MQPAAAAGCLTTHPLREYSLLLRGVVMRTGIVKWCDRTGLRVPQSFADEVQVAEGSPVDLIFEVGQLVVRVVQHPEYLLDDLLRGVTDTDLHTEFASGNPVGGEEW